MKQTQENVENPIFGLFWAHQAQFWPVLGLLDTIWGQNFFFFKNQALPLL